MHNVINKSTITSTGGPNRNTSHFGEIIADHRAGSLGPHGISFFLLSGFISLIYD